MFTRVLKNTAARSICMSRRVGNSIPKGAMAMSTSFQKASKTSALAIALTSTVAVLGSTYAYAENAAPVLPYTGIAGTHHERTFIAIKPDGVQRGLIHKVIGRFEEKGYKLVAMKMMTSTEDRARDHYADLSKRPFFNGLVKYFSSGPIIAMVWEGQDVILTGRALLGATNPNDALPGTLRGDNCISTGRNLLHGSDGPESAAHEIGMWFTEAEINTYGRALDEWIVATN